jgi:hypothetical protein
MVSFGTRGFTQGGGSKSNFALLTIPKDKDLQVSFLEDPDEWYKWYEHYSSEWGFFPCLNSSECPGCRSKTEETQKTSTRYLAAVWNYAYKEVRALKLPMDLSNDLASKATRLGGSLKGTDFVLYREGTGLTTKYKFDTAGASTVPDGPKELPDPEEKLMESFQSTFQDYKPPTITREQNNSKGWAGATSSPEEMMGKLADQVQKQEKQEEKSAPF